MLERLCVENWRKNFFCKKKSKYQESEEDEKEYQGMHNGSRKGRSVQSTCGARIKQAGKSCSEAHPNGLSRIDHNGDEHLPRSWRRKHHVVLVQELPLKKRREFFETDLHMRNR
jgi:hypothetical protein